MHEGLCRLAFHGDLHIILINYYLHTFQGSTKVLPRIVCVSRPGGCVMMTKLSDYPLCGSVV